MTIERNRRERIGGEGSKEGYRIRSLNSGTVRYIKSSKRMGPHDSREVTAISAGYCALDPEWGSLRLSVRPLLESHNKRNRIKLLSSSLLGPHRHQRRLPLPPWRIRILSQWGMRSGPRMGLTASLRPSSSRIPQ